jgi:hypothetical protein
VNPRPSSVTTSVAASGAKSRRTLTRAASAWRRALVMPSCARPVQRSQRGNRVAVLLAADVDRSRSVSRAGAARSATAALRRNGGAPGLQRAHRAAHVVERQAHGADGASTSAVFGRDGIAVAHGARLFQQDRRLV